ncbi:DnaB-like helicase N-terminal domain-containing protein [Kitasatospora aburaviensis]|uniref:DnaB-like helicase N-terminal domain-containing protein n=1 Tax=Kitasatospora aburaviensis TaxID=67265 RepID=A0ABW1F453_9ACTN
MTGAPEQGRLIPAALRPTDYAEQALLGGALLRPTQLRNLRWITPQDFSNPARAWLWNTLHRMPADQVSPMAVTTAARSADAGTQRLLSPHHLAGFVDACPNPSSAPLYGGMVLESSLHRLVDSIGSELCTRAAHGSPDEVGDLVADAVRGGRELPGMAVRWATVPETVRSLLDTTSDRSPDPAPALVRSRTDPPAEHATIASLLVWPQQMEEIGRWLHAADFSDPVNASVYRAIERLADRRAPVDPLTVTWEAQRAGGVVPDSALLEELGRSAAPGQAEYAGAAVLGAAALDRLDHAGTHVAQLAADASLSVPTLLASASSAIAPLEATHQRLQQIDTPAHTLTEAAATTPATRTEMEIDL